MNPVAFTKLVKSRLQFIYKDRFSEDWHRRFLQLVEENRQKETGQERVAPTSKWNEKDMILITYGNTIISGHEYPLEVLNRFLHRHLAHTVTCVHVLPFFPYSSDDGFSIMDYMKVNPGLGTWDHILKINRGFDLMVDLVMNHVSRYHPWFRNFLDRRDPGRDYFIEADPQTDLSMVVRPRSSPLLTPFQTEAGTRHVWTTFSADQADLNFASPAVLVEILRVFFHYIRYGAKIIRLDAIAYIWKQLGTSCIHLPEVHEIVKLMRDITEYAAPHVILLTETNVPNTENMSYFGRGDEANMVYQFSLPPLLLHALHTGNSGYLTRWASQVTDPGPGCTYFNFTASHDGIGVRPLEGLLPEKEIQELVANMKGFGGRVNTKRNADGTDTPYELNITYYDALKGTREGADAFQEERFICSQTIMMALKGIPAFYIHSLTATPNDEERVKQTGVNRSINRSQWQESHLEESLQTDTPHGRVFHALVHGMEIRKGESCFHPDAAQEVLEMGQAFFVFKRSRGGRNLISVSNLTRQRQTLSLQRHLQPDAVLRDILAGKPFQSTEPLPFAAYQTRWLLVE